MTILVVLAVILLATVSIDAYRAPILPTFLRRLQSSTSLGATTADFKNGMTFELGKMHVKVQLLLCAALITHFCVCIDGVPVRLVEFLHVKPGKGSAFVRSKVKNLLNGNVIEKTFRAGESIQLAEVTKTAMQYTFSDGDSVCFMNMETFEEERIDKSMISNVLLLKEGEICCIRFPMHALL